MLARTGNLADVYRELWQMHDIAQQVEPGMNAAARVTASMEAEITEGASADWYLVHTFPSDDLKAMRYLARRRFGVFRPMQQRQRARNEGQQIGGMEPVFPGWLFVYCWDIKKMRSRILSAPGVMAMLSDPVTLAPIPILDAFVQRLRALAWMYEERLGHVAQESRRHQQRGKPRRPDKHERKALDRLKKTMKQNGMEWDPSTWEGINTLAPHERIALLTRRLTPPVAG